MVGVSLSRIDTILASTELLKNTTQKFKSGGLNEKRVKISLVQCWSESGMGCCGTGTILEQVAKVCSRKVAQEIWAQDTHLAWEIGWPWKILQADMIFKTMVFNWVVSDRLLNDCYGTIVTCLISQNLQKENNLKDKTELGL